MTYDIYLLFQGGWEKSLVAGFTKAVRFLSTGFSLRVTVAFSQAGAAMCCKCFNKRLPKVWPRTFLPECKDHL